MTGTSGCRHNTVVHANCDRCGQTPKVVHRPRNERNACYCEDCCPVCKQQQPAAGRASHRASSYGATGDSVRRSGRE
jgi:hypothetical protein